MGKLRNMRKGNFVLLFGCLLGFLNMCLYWLNMHSAYYRDMNMRLLVPAALVWIAPAAAFVIGLYSKNPVYDLLRDALRVAAAGMTAVGGGIFISMRVESFGYIFGSNLEAGNQAAFSAANQAVFAIVLFIATWIVTVIGAFFSIGIGRCED